MSTEANLGPFAQREGLFIPKHGVQNRLQAMHDELPHEGAWWLGGMPRDERRYIEGCRAGIMAAFNSVAKGGGATVAGLVGDREDGKCAWCEGTGTDGLTDD